MQAEAVGELRVERQLRRELPGQEHREARDARRVRRGLAEAAAAVVVQLERAGQRLDGGGRNFRRAWVVECLAVMSPASVPVGSEASARSMPH